MTGEFQAQVNVAQAPFVPGDFVSKNPRKFFLAGPGGLVAGTGGVTVGPDQVRADTVATGAVRFTGPPAESFM